MLIHSQLFYLSSLYSWKICTLSTQQKRSSCFPIIIQIEAFQGNEHEVKQQLSVVKDKFTEITQDTQKEIARFTIERSKLHQQRESAQEEYDCLKVLHKQEMDQRAEMEKVRSR